MNFVGFYRLAWMFVKVVIHVSLSWWLCLSVGVVHVVLLLFVVLVCTRLRLDLIVTLVLLLFC